MFSFAVMVKRWVGLNGASTVNQKWDDSGLIELSGGVFVELSPALGVLSNSACGRAVVHCRNKSRFIDRGCLIRELHEAFEL